MAQRVLDIFYEISKIPHCSYNTAFLLEYITNFALLNGYEVSVDDAKNILARRNNPKICLQSHYDMVCIGDTDNLEIVIDKNYISAKNSTLGADNGIGVATMLALMEEKSDAEFLFTNDEEVGLIGAKNLKLDIKSKVILNLDSEEEDGIFIGCAGGFDFEAKIPLKHTICLQNLKKITTKNFLGGHSGIEIDKNIPNAIKELLFFIKQNDMRMHYISGGERRNSIPVNVQAIVYTTNDICPTHNFLIEDFDDNDIDLYDCSKLSSILLSFPTGVRSWNKEFGIPNDSINLATIKIENDIAVLNISGRSMDNESLEKLKIETKEFFDGCEIKISDEYPAWRPENTEFAKKVLQIYSQENKNAQLKVIHAGLECGVLKNVLKGTDAVSIGPNIFLPHTKNEKVEIDSIFRVFKIIKKIIK